MSDDEDEIKKVIEDVIRQHHWADDNVQKALLEVARNHIWKQGLWARMKYVVNVAGFLGGMSAFIMALVALFGWEMTIK